MHLIWYNLSETLSDYCFSDVSRHLCIRETKERRTILPEAGKIVIRTSESSETLKIRSSGNFDTKNTASTRGLIKSKLPGLMNIHLLYWPLPLCLRSEEADVASASSCCSPELAPDWRFLTFQTFPVFCSITPTVIQHFEIARLFAACMYWIIMVNLRTIRTHTWSCVCVCVCSFNNQIFTEAIQ